MCKKVDVPLSYTFHEVNKLFINNIKNESEMLGINPSYRYVFMALKNNENGLSQSEICEIVHFKKSSISLLLQQMENEELISRHKSELDSRQTIVKLTEKGIALDEKIKNIFIKCEQKMIDSINISLNLMFDKLREQEGIKKGKLCLDS